jgi:hypothetical protein
MVAMEQRGELPAALRRAPPYTRFEMHMRASRDFLQPLCASAADVGGGALNGGVSAAAPPTGAVSDPFVSPTLPLLAPSELALFGPFDPNSPLEHPLASPTTNPAPRQDQEAEQGEQGCEGKTAGELGGCQERGSLGAGAAAAEAAQPPPSPPPPTPSQVAAANRKERAKRAAARSNVEGRRGLGPCARKAVEHARSAAGVKTGRSVESIINGSVGLTNRKDNHNKDSGGSSSNSSNSFVRSAVQAKGAGSMPPQFLAELASNRLFKSKSAHAAEGPSATRRLKGRNNKDDQTHQANKFV